MACFYLMTNIKAESPRWTFGFYILRIGSAKHACLLLIQDPECRELSDKGDRPGYAVAEVQTLGGVIGLEHCGQPQQANAAHAQHRYDHRAKAGTHASQRAGGYIH